VPDLVGVEGGELAGDGDLAGAEQQEPGAVDPAGAAPAVRSSRRVSPRKVSGLPAGPVWVVVSGTRPVVVGMASVVGTAVVPGRVVAVARVVAVGTGLVVEESTRAGPEPPQPARAQAASAASATLTLERRPGNSEPHALYAGFPPGPVSSRP
jgi:hypothetical protein